MDQDSDYNICRICLNVQDTLFSLFRKRHGTSPYEKLISRTNLRIQLNDAGPPSICSQCLIDLDTTVNFLEKCERSNELMVARLAEGLDDRSKYKADLLEVESEYKHISYTESNETREETLHEVEGKLSGVILQDAKCPECGSKRRCKHWAPPRSHTCALCGKTFNKKYNYQLHVKRHLGESEWSCLACGARQLTRCAAERHCRARRRLACPAPRCGKSFTTTTNLRIHLRKHSGERPFECGECGNKFISKNILNNHMRTHTGVKPYMCQVCGKQFATNKLAAHMTSHAPPGPGPAPAPPAHRCALPACQRAFRSARALRSHLRTHTCEKAYACARCGAAYKFKQSLNYHVKHTHGAQAKTIAPKSPEISNNCIISECSTDKA